METGLVIVGVGLLIVFATFAHLLLNARGLMRLVKPMSGGEIRVGQGHEGSSRGTILFSLILHFVGWAIAAIAYFTMVAQVAETAPERGEIPATVNGTTAR
ncbi:hypothetical protein GCM10011515_18770 [Tsuneonella deserti]|uniref:Uncharacterized protein n=1 Tax=Tsuneonella deserti TaxID=2035528 RepID=A0ABQ1SAQ6_9SPHN|nr:hypothetical protein [Tsuneonella deserti]GGD99157.1 hypothetical protein GCM10011515_18770 [Tsuneonella deserti]